MENNSQEVFKRNIKRIIDLENEEKQLNIIYGDKKIKYIRTKNTEGITKKLIYEKLRNYFQSEKSATEATEYIYKDRASDYKTTIKITDVKNK